jgi:amidohydrolase
LAHVPIKMKNPLQIDQMDMQITNGRLAEHRDFLVNVRRHLHQYPEIGFQETNTSQFIREALEQQGLKVRGPIAETGLVVDIEGQRPGETVAYRADIDALPIQDLKEVPYASTIPGIAHLCGHDVHSSVAMGVALQLQERRHEMEGTVRVFFQPAEEGNPSGALPMIREGVLEGVKSIYAIHVDPTLSVGRFGLKTGPITAGYDSFSISVLGDSTGHSARPHQSVDTIWLASQVMSTLYQLVGRVNDARNSAILTITRITGGKALNVIPRKVEFGGSLRCIDRDDRVYLRRQVEKTTRHFAALYNAEIDFQLFKGAPAVHNDPELVDLARTTIVDRFGEAAIFDVPVPSMGSEDFAHYLDHIPGALIRVGTSDGPSTSYPLHDSRFDIAESVLPLATDTVSDMLINHLRMRARMARQ